MGTIIQWADFAGAAEAITQTTKLVSGLFPTEAAAALDWVKVPMKDGTVRFVLNTAKEIFQQNNVIQFPGTDAAQAFNDYINSGGLATAGGAAAGGAAISKASNLTLLKSGTYSGIGALLSMNLPAIAAAIAPLAGVAIGALLYTANPDFWEKISRTLLPFCYPDTNLTPVVADETGKTYFQKEMVDNTIQILSNNETTVNVNELPEELKNAIDLPASDPSRTYPFRFSSSVQNVEFTIRYRRSTEETIFTADGSLTFDKPVKIAFARSRLGQNLSISASSNEPFTLTKIVGSGSLFNFSGNNSAPITINGKEAECIYGLLKSGLSIVSITVRNIIERFVVLRTIYDTVMEQIGWLMENGSEQYFEEGTSKWTGVKYPTNPPQINVISRVEDNSFNSLPYYPISVPTGEPGVSLTPTEVSDLTINPKPNPAINPWISTSPSPETYPAEFPYSEPAPLPNPVPDYSPNLNPWSDPSQQPETQPQPQPDPEPKPAPSGDSPKPINPILPSQSAAAGLLHVYNPTQSQIYSFGRWLWTTFSGDIIDTVSKLFNNPMDAVIGLHELYVTPTKGSSTTIRAGYLDSDVSSALVGNRYSQLNCGSVVVPEFYRNYLDYSPYTKCFIYLPFVGIVPVLADDIIGNATNITYNIDAYTGCCIAIVTVAREGYSSTVYQFEGNCAVSVPITSGYQSSIMSALLGIAGTAITGMPHVGLSAASLGRASLGKNDASHSGSFGSSYGAMGAKIPYIIVKRPTQKNVFNYNQEYGFPAHARVTIGNCTGYLRAKEVHVISPTATDEEKARIEELLKEGVFVK